MAVILPFKGKKEDPSSAFYVTGQSRCLNCKFEWVAIAEDYVAIGLECPSCGLFQGVFIGLIVPKLRFVCNCGSDLYYIIPDGCQCVRCGSIATGF